MSDILQVVVFSVCAYVCLYGLLIDWSFLFVASMHLLEALFFRQLCSLALLHNTVCISLRLHSYWSVYCIPFFYPINFLVLLEKWQAIFKKCHSEINFMRVCYFISWKIKYFKSSEMKIHFYNRWYLTITLNQATHLIQGLLLVYTQKSLQKPSVATFLWKTLLSQLNLPNR